jgi:DNA-binding protein H-NS
LLAARANIDRILSRKVEVERRSLKAKLARLETFTDSVGGRRRAHPLKGAKVPPKYRDPKTGATWAGRGVQPRWLRAAIKSGQKLESFLIARGPRRGRRAR